MVNAQTGQVKSTKNHMPGNPTYRDLAAQSDDNFRVADNTAGMCQAASTYMEVFVPLSPAETHGLVIQGLINCAKLAF